MKRRLAREYAFKLIYELGVQTEKDMASLIADTAEAQEFEPDDYIRKAVRGVSEKKEELDALISESAKKWRLERLSLASLSIMRLATYEMLYMEDVPFCVAINEAVELAKSYDHDKSPKFINGILNAIAEKKGLKAAKTVNKEENNV
ncbi:MAG: transcription antitermination factor NusB [Clostridia bacterium]|nr:transcription antitermination factor NusB [Clostridia bacterium]